MTVIGLALASMGLVLVAQVAPGAAPQALALVGALPATQGAVELDDLSALAAALAVSGIGLGLTIAPLTTVVIDASGPERHGMAASLVIALRLLGMMVGTSLLTTYGVRRWATLAPTVFADIPLDQPARLADAAFALTSMIADEMLLAAAAISVLALGIAFGLPSAAALEER